MEKYSLLLLPGWGTSPRIFDTLLAGLPAQRHSQAGNSQAGDAELADFQRLSLRLSLRLPLELPWQDFLQVSQNTVSAKRELLVQCALAHFREGSDPKEGDSRRLEGERKAERAEKEWVILGWSLGGMLGLELGLELLKSGHRVALILLSSTASMCGAAEADSPKAVNPALLSRMQEKLQEGLKTTVLQDFARNCQRSSAPLEMNFCEQLLAQSQGISVAQLQMGLDYLKHTDLRAQLPELRNSRPNGKLRALVLHGQQDRIIPAAQGAYLAEGLGAEFYLLEAAHNLLCPPAPTLLQRIQDFLPL